MLNFKSISKIFITFLDGKKASQSKEAINRLIRSCIATNKKLWDLEDSARMVERGSEHIVKAKQNIDRNNTIRNELIRKIDIEIAAQLDSSTASDKHRYSSETPGMIIDRLAILFIK